MSEILVKTRDGEIEEDDIIFACNRRMILSCHAQHLCHVKRAQRNGSGLIAVGDVFQDWCEATFQYKYVRRSADEVERIEIATGDSEVFRDFDEDDPSQKMHMDVRLFLRLRKRNRLHYIFGEEGQEFWYGGTTDTSTPKIAQVWTGIENKTDRNRDESEFQFWPFGRESEPQEIRLRLTPKQRRKLFDRGETPPFGIRYFHASREYRVGVEGDKVMAILGGQELRSHSCHLISDDLDDGEIDDINEPEFEDVDGKRQLRRKRKYRARWKTMRGMGRNQERDTLDLTKWVDNRVHGTNARNKIGRKPRGRRR